MYQQLVAEMKGTKGSLHHPSQYWWEINTKDFIITTNSSKKQIEIFSFLPDVLEVLKARGFASSEATITQNNPKTLKKKYDSERPVYQWFKKYPDKLFAKGEEQKFLQSLFIEALTEWEKTHQQWESEIQYSESYEPTTKVKVLSLKASNCAYEIGEIINEENFPGRTIPTEGEFETPFYRGLVLGKGQKKIKTILAYPNWKLPERPKKENFKMY